MPLCKHVCMCVFNDIEYGARACMYFYGGSPVPEIHSTRVSSFRLFEIES